MNEAQITVVGWLAADPFYNTTTHGTPYLTLRIGCTPRRFDRQLGQWRDLDSMFLTVNCWRGLADNVNASELRRGQPVVITGRLRIREYVKDGQFRFSAEIEATTLGHDLSRGSALFRPVRRSGVMTDDDRLEAQEQADQWALGGSAVDPGPSAVPAGEEGEEGERDRPFAPEAQDTVGPENAAA